MKFVKDGWHWLEIDDYGNVVGSMTNSEHALYMKQATIHHANEWIHAHTDYHILMAYPDYLHQVIHALQTPTHTILSALGVNAV